MTDPNIRLNSLFGQFTESAWRWECQTDYAVDHEALARWKHGQPRDTAGKQRWLDYIRKITSTGRRFDRVRVYTEPLNDYLTWMIEFTHENVEAGEDIRWLAQSAARELGMPTYDFYLFDDARLAIMRFDPNTKLLADLEETEEPGVVEQHRFYRDRVWMRAVKHADLPA